MIPLGDRWLDYRETCRDLERAMDRPAYVLTGEENFLVRLVRDRLITSLIPREAKTMDLVKMAGDGRPSSIDRDRLLAEIRTPPFLSDHKLICLEDSGFFAGRSGAAVDQELEAALIDMPPACHLIFVEETVSASHGLLRKMRKTGTLTAKMDRQRLADLQKWVSGLCGREQLRITREAADSLITRCEFSMADIASDLTVLFLYFKYTGKSAITLADVDYLGRDDLSGSIFDLTDAIGAGRVDRALEKLDTLLARREAPLFIQTMLARQARDLLVAVECGSEDQIMASGVTQSQFLARKLASQARRFTTGRLEALVESCFQADLAVKTGRLGGEEALSILVIKACGHA